MSFFSCKHLEKKYGNESIFEDITLSFPDRGLIFLTGESGAGKSTLIYCLMGIEKCQGKVYYQNEEIKDFEKFRKEHTSIIFQNFYLLDELTVEENINVLNPLQDKTLIDKLGLTNLWKKKVKYLSGGEKQRVCIARSLTSSPDIIFADEITGSLDEENSFIIMEMMKEISKNKLVIMISHNEELVSKYADYVLKLKKKLLVDLSNKNNKNHSSINKISFKRRLLDSLYLMRKSLDKIVLSIISLIISFVLLGVSLNVSYIFSSYLEQYKTSAPDYNFLELSKITKNKIEGTSFSLIKSEIPSEEDLSIISPLIKDVDMGYSMNKVLNSYTSLTNEGEKIEVSFCPYLDFNNEDINEIYINPTLNKIIKGKYLNYKLQREIEYQSVLNKITSDYLNIEIIFEIKEITQEMDLFDNPRIYYPYNAFNEYFKSIKLPNLSLELEKNISLYSRITMYSYDNDYFNDGYLYLIPPFNKVETYLKIINNSNYEINFEISSRALTSYNSIKVLFDSIKEAIMIFVGISSVVSILVLILALNSLIFDERKEIAIFKSLGMNSKEFNSIYLMQILCILLTSYLLSFLFKIMCYKIINHYISFISFNNVSGLQYENYLSLLVFLIAAFISYIFGRRIIKKLDLAKILKEE
jgi:ABC-type lipoprotein export system ATPase subunit